MAEVVIVETAEDAGAVAADIIQRIIAGKPDAVLGLATGSSPLSTWRALADRKVDMSRVRGFALDEYVGLSAGHPESYAAVIARDAVGPLGLTPALVHVPAGQGRIEDAGENYELAIQQAGGVDVQVLGIGRTGHIGFNEPGSSFASLTRVKTLTEQTRRDNARFFGSIDDVPVHCVTQGLGTIMRARQLVLLAFGEAKAEVLAGAVEGPLTSSLPASLIQLHPRVTVIVDEAAASLLRYAEYYRYAWEHRLAWER